MYKIYKYSGNPFVKLNKLQKKIINTITELHKKCSYFEENPCICDKSDSILISERCRYGLNINFKLCKNCGIIRQDPIMTEDSTKGFYKNFYRKLYTGKEDYENKERIFLSQYKSGKKYYSLICNELLKRNCSMKNLSSILEIGSSCGGILKFFLDNKHDVFALDYDQEYIEFGKKKGIVKIFNDIDKIDIKFNLIILSHTFEHFKDLKKKIDQIENLLDENGFIFLDLPGIFNFDYYHFRNFFYNHNRAHFLFHLQNAHNYYFTKETLSNFIKNYSKLEIIYIDDKINCILRKSNKKITVNSYNKNFYKKILNFLKFNHFRYLILKKLLFFFIPIFKIKKFFNKKN